MATVRPAPGPRVAGRGRRRAARDQKGPILNRELSWIEFNARVLHEARDTRNPLLERVKFLAIFASNLDEFFQVRVSGLRRQDQSRGIHHSLDGLTPSQQLDAIRDRVRELIADHSDIWTEIRGELAAEGVQIHDYDEVPEHHETLRRRFHDEIFPVLTPLAVDPGHPFPYISTLSLSIAVGLRDPETGEKRFARVKIPPILPRLFAVERDKFVLLDQVIEANLDELFRGMEILETHLFRVTRDADIAIEEDEADDLLLAIEEEIRRRRFGEAVRLEVERSMPELTRQILIKGTGVRDEDAFEVAGMLDLTALWQLVSLDRPDLKAPVHSPVIPQRLLPPDEDEPTDVFAQMRAGDIFVHHPYESFTASTERFIDQAADDPEVLTIKQTLYRTSGQSPIVGALIRAAEAGKQVVVLVEIKARFDEENNIVWARRLEQAGAHVVYGLVGLKTHSKVALVVRREGSGLRRYIHIGTGNYNGKTARLYTDLGLLTCREELGADVTDLFNVLTGLSRQRVFRRLLVAPMTMRTRFIEMVEREARQRAGRPPGPDRAQGQLARGRPGDRGALRGLEGRRGDRPHRARRVLPRPGRRGRQRADPRPLDHRRVPRALEDLDVQQRRPRRVVHGLRRPHGAQPGPAGRGGDAGRGPRGPGPPRPDHRGPPRRRPPLVAAGRATGAGHARRSSSPARGRWRPSPSSRRTPRPRARSPTSRAGRTRTPGSMDPRA